MRRFLLGIIGVVAVAGGFALAPISGTIPNAAAATARTEVPQQHTSGPVCSASLNGCEEVYNSAQGSDYIDYVIVYDANDQGYYGTYRLLFNGSVRYSVTGYGPVEFILDYTTASGNCIQGGIVGLSDARSPCWYAP
jgi:hypothetical protein